MTTASATITTPKVNYHTKQRLFNRLARNLSGAPGYVKTITLDDRGNFSVVMMNELKRCSICNFTKSMEDFYANAKSPDGLETACKECRT